jgi:hypothetical protein
MDKIGNIRHHIVFREVTFEFFEALLETYRDQDVFRG